MTKRPWMPLYVGDYQRKTRHLSLAEHGAYMLLIMEYWAAGGLPDDDERLARIVGATSRQWRKVKPAVRSFFGTNWRHQRIDEELAHSAEISNKRKAAALQKQSKSTASAPANADTLHTSQRKEEKEDTANAVLSMAYFFESGTIRLSERDFRKWETAFVNINLRAELIALSGWAEKQENWFFAVAGALAKRDREALAAKQRAAAGPLVKGSNGQMVPKGSKYDPTAGII